MTNLLENAIDFSPQGSAVIIAELHGGTIILESADGGGTVAKLILPHL